jgi:hypothetical protein
VACYECRRRGGRHTPSCRVETRRWRRGPARRYDCVTLDAIGEVYEAERALCLRIVSRSLPLPRVVDASDAEDVLHDTVVTLLRRRAFVWGAAPYLLAGVRYRVSGLRLRGARYALYNDDALDRLATAGRDRWAW